MNPGEDWQAKGREADEDAGGEIRLDPQSEERLFQRIMSAIAAERSAAGRYWRTLAGAGGLAFAATVMIAAVGAWPQSPEVLSGFGLPGAASVTAIRTPAPPPPIAFGKPPFKLSSSASAWRGSAAGQRFVTLLAPAADAYREGRYATAEVEFERLSIMYPASIEVLFYLGVSRMLAGKDAAAIAPLEAASQLRSPTFDRDLPRLLALARQRAGP